MPLIDVNPVKTIQSLQISRKSDQNVNLDILKKSVVLRPNFERLSSVPPYSESVRQGRKRRRLERDQTAGPKWFGLEKGSLEENIDDMEILRMRSNLGAILGKRQYYRSADRKEVPKYFQKGEIVETAADFYSGRVPKKQRKKSLVEELLADAEIKKTQQKKYDVVASREMKRRRAAAVRNMKRMKKNKRR